MRLTRRLLLGTLLAALLATAVPPLYAQGYSTGTAITKAITLTAASYSAAARYLSSTVLLSPTGGTVTITGSNSIAATSGQITLATGKTFQDGFLYGTRGKAIINGTMNQVSAGRATGVIGQTDTTGATLTAGQVSGIWADLQGNAENAETYALRVSNSMSVSPPALALFVGHATAALEVSDLGNGSSGDFVVNTSGTSAGQCAQTGGLVATKAVKIVADGTNYWLPLCTAP